jgi:hypothetical protein
LPRIEVDNISYIRKDNVIRFPRAYWFTFRI